VQAVGLSLGHPSRCVLPKRDMFDCVSHQKAQDQVIKLSALVEASSDMDLQGKVVPATQSQFPSGASVEALEVSIARHWRFGEIYHQQPQQMNTLSTTLLQSQCRDHIVMVGAGKMR